MAGVTAAAVIADHQIRLSSRFGGGVLAFQAAREDL